MGNFAENLNLGNRFRPPPCQNLNFCTYLYMVALSKEANFLKGTKQKSFQWEI